MNVATEEKKDGSKRRVLVATKDFNPGDLIYKVGNLCELDFSTDPHCVG